MLQYVTKRIEARTWFEDSTDAMNGVKNSRTEGKKFINKVSKCDVLKVKNAEMYPKERRERGGRKRNL